MSKISSPTASIAVVAAFLLSGIGAGVPIDSARAASNNAANCAAAPNASPPQGQHWYYRLDHVNHRKCWYLHATVALPPRAVAPRPAEAAYAEPTPHPPASVPPSARNAEATWPAASAPPSASNVGAAQPAASAPLSESSADPDQAEPHVTVLTVKPVAAPFVDATTQPQQSASANIGAPPAPQTLPREENATNDVDDPPDNADKAPVQAAPEAAHQELAQTEFAQTTDNANAAARTNLAGMFLLLALAFGSAAVLIAFATKLVRRYGEPRITDHPDDAWISYRAALQPDEEAAYDEQYEEAAPYDEQEVPYLDPQAEHGLADLHEEQWIDQSSSAEAALSPARFQDDAQFQDEAPAESWEPELKDIELALRILQRARQGRVA